MGDRIRLSSVPCRASEVLVLDRLNQPHRSTEVASGSIQGPPDFFPHSSVLSLCCVGFRFPRILGMTLEYLYIGVLGNYHLVRLNNRTAFNVSDLRRCCVSLPHNSPHSNSGRSESRIEDRAASRGSPMSRSLGDPLNSTLAHARSREIDTEHCCCCRALLDQRSPSYRRPTIIGTCQTCPLRQLGRCRGPRRRTPLNERSGDDALTQDRCEISSVTVA